MIYCIDSHNFIWCVKKQADELDKYRLEEAEMFMHHIDKYKHQLMVPSIVLAECLIREPEDNHIQIISEAKKRFMVVDFDTRCALKYGELLRLDNFIAAKKMAKDNDIRREKMKLDHMIVSCALVHGAKAIYSSDDDVIKFSKDIIPVYDLPYLAAQSAMFDNTGTPLVNNNNISDANS